MNLTTRLLGIFMILATHVFTQDRTTFSAYPTDNAGMAPCKADQIHTKMMNSDPQYRRKYLSSNNYIRQIIANPLREVNGTVYTIPVVVHIIHLGEAVGAGPNISDAQVASAIDALNRDFRMVAGSIGDGSANTPVPGVDVEIEFCLAVRDPNDQPHSGINRINGSSVTNYSAQGITDANEVNVKDLSRWDNRFYYNVWVVTEIDDNGGGAGTQGYAYFPTNPVTWNADKDGTVVLFNAFGNDPGGALGYNLKSYTNLGRTMTHEIGHGLNLHHPFEGASCTEGDCSTQGDEVCDTPPTTQQTNCGTPACSSTQQVENYMDYTGGTCVNMFTQGQKDRMRAALTGPRVELTTSDGCTPTNDLDASIFGITYPSGSICASSFDPIIEIKNLGVQTLTTATITFDIDGAGTQTLNWTGSLATGQTEVITLANMTTTAGAHIFNVAITSPNGGTDENTGNDNSSSNFTVQIGNQAILTLTLDNFASETTWSLMDGGTTLYSGGPYTDGTNGTVISEEFCLADGCYDFVINDSYGDGICCTNGNGSWDVSAGGSTLVSGSSFTSTSSQNFCIDSNPPTADFSADVTNICAGQTVNYTDASSTNTTSWAWTFTGGTPSSSTDQNPVIVYNTAGTYDVTLVSTNGNGNDTKTETSYITVGPALTISTTVTDESCPGTCDGSATVNVTAGTSPYTYAWNDPGTQTTATASGLCSGLVSITVSDAAGCSTNENVNITAPSTYSLTSSSTDASCSSPDGTTTVNVVGGTGPFTYSWDDAGNQSTATATALSSGDYTVTVSDAAGCSQTATETVVSSGGISVSASMTNGTCGASCSGEAVASASGGQTPYTYSWNDPATQTTATATGLCLGSVTVTITDNNGCSADATVNIANSGNLDVSSSSVNASCGNSDGTATATVLTGSAPYNFSWSNGGNTSTISALNAGDYDVTVTDANGCTHSETVTVSTTNGPSSTATNTNIDCFGSCDASATVTVSDGVAPYNYSWDDANSQNNPTAFNLCAGTYTATITDVNGCITTSIVTVTEPSALTATTASNDATCGNSDGTGAITVSGGTSPYTYSWATGDNTSSVSNLSAGLYSVTVTDANGCTLNESVNISNAGGPSSTTSFTNVNCYNACDGTASITVTGSAPFTYSWNDPGSSTTPTASNLCPGNYGVTVTDANGCVVSESYTITEPNELIVNTETTNENCGNTDGTATITVSGGSSPYSYSWSSGQTTANLSNVGTGTYTITVTDANGCQATNTILIGENFGPSVTLTTNKISCNNACDGEAIAAITGGQAPYLISWDDPASQTTTTAINLCEGTFTVTITDAGGCQAIQNTSLTNPSALSATATVTPANCSNPDGSVDYAVSGGTAPYTYDWSNGGTSANQTGMTGGFYSVTVEDDNGCTLTETIEVTASGGPSISMSNSDATCYGSCDGSARVTVTGGTAPFQYNWSDGQTSVTAFDLCPGIYNVVVTDANGCITTGTAIVNQAVAIGIDLDLSAEQCGTADGSATATISGGASPYTLNWSDGQSGTSAIGLSAGNFSVTVIDNMGCANTSNFIIDVAPLPVALVTEDVTICENTSVTLAASGGISYTWSNGETSAQNTVSPTTETTYTVTAFDGTCNSEPASVTISVETNPTTDVSPGNSTICIGESITLTAVGGTEYLWNTNETDASINVSPSSTTSYSVVALKDGCLGSSEMVTVIVLPNGIQAAASASENVVSIPGSGGQVQLSNESGPCDTYEWTFGDGFTSNLENPLHTYTAEGSYEVNLTVTIGTCTSTTSMTIIVINDVSINDLKKLDFTVFPNPSNGMISITGNHVIDVIKVYNSIGQLLNTEIVNNDQTQINLSTYSTGIYYLEIESDHQKTYERVSIIK